MENGQKVAHHAAKPCSSKLIETRKTIARSAADAAAERLALQRSGALAYENADIAVLEARVEAQARKTAHYRDLELAGTEAGFARPVSGMTCSGSGEVYASDWSGTLYEINFERMERSRQASISRGRTTLAASRRPGVLYSGCDDGISAIVDLRVEASASCGARVASVDEHARLDLLAAGVYDNTFRLYDTHTMQQLALQVCSSRPTHAVKFHPDGGLLAVSGHDARTRLWDLRSGKPVLELANHTREIYATDWHPNGYQLATGGADCTIYEWDIRNKQSVMLPAHTNIVTALEYRDQLLLSASFDATIKVWLGSSLIKVHTLTDKVLSFACAAGGIVAGKKDCTVEFLSKSV